MQMKCLSTKTRRTKFRLVFVLFVMAEEKKKREISSVKSIDVINHLISSSPRRLIFGDI